CGRIAAWPEHAHQAFHWRTGRRGQLLEADGGVDISAQRRFGGVEIAGEQRLHRLGKQRRTECRIARCALAQRGIEAAGQRHFFYLLRALTLRALYSRHSISASAISRCCRRLVPPPSSTTSVLPTQPK